MQLGQQDFPSNGFEDMEIRVHIKLTFDTVLLYNKTWLKI